MVIKVKCPKLADNPNPYPFYLNTDNVCTFRQTTPEENLIDGLFNTSVAFTSDGNWCRLDEESTLRYVYAIGLNIDFQKPQPPAVIPKTFYDVKDIVGLKIDKAYRTEHGFILETNEGLLELTPDGDCCSECTLTDMDFTNVLFDAEVLKVEDLELPKVPNSEDPERSDNSHNVTDVWGYRIHTTKGICTIGMRLDHNGYYSGKLSTQINNDLDLSKLKLLDDFS